MILLFYVLGEAVSLAIQLIFPSVFLPGTVIGMLLLLTFLLTKRLKIEAVDEVGSFLTNNMAFFFIPAAVSVLEYFEILQEVFIKIIIISIISVIFSFFMIAYVVKMTIVIQDKIAAKRGEDNV